MARRRIMPRWQRLREARAANLHTLRYTHFGAGSGIEKVSLGTAAAYAGEGEERRRVRPGTARQQGR